MMKNLKCVKSRTGDSTSCDDHHQKALELTMSSSLISSIIQRIEIMRLFRKHSRLSANPVYRNQFVELADRSWDDLIRRLPIIMLEDSALHPDFGLLVWLMVAESKGYCPCMLLVRRVMQIVSEVASCARQDATSRDEYMDESHIISYHCIFC
jgi:hypothetical protein